MKGRRTHTLPLTDGMRALLPNRLGLLFPTENTRTFSNWSRSKHRLDDVSGVIEEHGEVDEGVVHLGWRLDHRVKQGRDIGRLDVRKDFLGEFWPETRSCPRWWCRSAGSLQGLRRV